MTTRRQTRSSPGLPTTGTTHSVRPPADAADVDAPDGAPDGPCDAPDGGSTRTPTQKRPRESAARNFASTMPGP